MKGKRILSLVLILAMFSAIVPTALAASDDAVTAANALYELGLFQGTGTNADGTPNFDLDRVPTRNEAVTMLVRLLGKEEEAKSGTWNIPFTDVADWAKPYVGYAYANGLTTGTGATTFGGSTAISASQYITFVLRALGYESGTDFQWDKAWELSDSIGLTNSQYKSDRIPFLRGDVAIISNNALSVKLNGFAVTLAQAIGLTLMPSTTEQSSEGSNLKPDDHTTEDIIVATPLLYDSSVVDDQITLSWGFHDTLVSGFELYVSESEYGDYTKITTITNAETRTYTFSGEAGKSYQFKVRAYVISNGKTTYSDYSSARRANIPGQTGLVIELPDLPVEVAWYKYNGEIYSSARITSVTYTVKEHSNGVKIDFYFSGVKPGMVQAIYTQSKVLGL